LLRAVLCGAGLHMKFRKVIEKRTVLLSELSLLIGKTKPFHFPIFPNLISMADAKPL
jgi:hypothetical protein